MGGGPIAADHTVISKSTTKLLNDLEGPVARIGVYPGIRMLPPLQLG
jgi:hypothetical protein